ncbi:hypothetical protein [Candidatus Pelagadaptatus aseana]|uniref:hypothetical protein n=1 Tax=Candidatus Pelagadaptatus aseana TaxID=3120508 RepID=UPI003C6EF2AD
MQLSKSGGYWTGLCRLIFLGVLLSLAPIAPVLAEALKPFRLGCVSSPDMPAARYLASVITPVLRREGYRLEMITDAADRLNDMLVRGELDGDCGRWKTFGDELEGVVRVEPSFRHEGFAIWGDQSLVQASTARLRLGYPRGWVMKSPILETLGYQSLHGYGDAKALLDAVAAGEIDAFVSYTAAVNKHRDPERHAAVMFHRDIVSLPVYLYLHPRWTALAEDFAKAIQLKQQQPLYTKEVPDQWFARSERRIVFSCLVPDRYPLFTEFESFYREAFAALGYNFSMISLPRAREIAELLNGRVDGVCARVDVEPFSSANNLQRLDIAVGNITQMVVSPVPLPEVPIGQLPQGRLGYVRGAQVSLTWLRAFPQMEQIVLNSSESGLKMLAAGRLDYLLDNSVAVNIMFRHLGVDIPLYRKPYGQPVPVYPFLNKRHLGIQQALQEQLVLQLRNYPENIILGR